ncbi:polymer-forming cytoskeletal protein [Candidatus Poribacteria bacterium]
MKLSKENSVSGKLDTYIGEDTSLDGIVTSSKSLTIFGTVKGTIQCQGRIVVGQSGNIEADIVADNVAVSGKVVGNVTAKSKLELTSTGIIQGDVKTARLIMEDGGKLDGHCEMLSEGKSAVAKEPKIEEKPSDPTPKEEAKQTASSRR